MNIRVADLRNNVVANLENYADELFGIGKKYENDQLYTAIKKLCHKPMLDAAIANATVPEPEAGKSDDMLDQVRIEISNFDKVVEFLYDRNEVQVAEIHRTQIKQVKEALHGLDE
ncbi:MAG: hypothetical protein O2983_01965 [Planctomycetota bacterium]|nr:hypothetical protein [Planctomycetota bacterium]MDA0919505.1 hypothetical protein [Planctomycetota bacterium]MDA1158351.1 hypothetical protein [Planctomycetota bacterium]